MKNTDEFMRIEGHPEPLEIEESYEPKAAAPVSPAPSATGKTHGGGSFLWAGIAALCVIAVCIGVYCLSGASRQVQPASGDTYSMQTGGIVSQVGNELADVGATDATMGDTPDAAMTAGEPDAVYLFAFDKSGLTEDVELNAVAREASATGAYVAVVAYTDEKGGDAYNQKLSEQRANQVASYLTAHGVPADHVKAKGYGETHAFPSNAQDRRAEVRIL